MRNRLLLGPVLIAAVVALAWGDGFLDRCALPEYLRPLFGGRETFPPGVLIAPFLALLGALATLELTAILRAKGVTTSRAWTTFSSLLGLCIAAFVPSNADAETAAAIVMTGAAMVLTGSMLLFARRRTTQGVAMACGSALIAFVYLGLMLGFILMIRREHAAWILLGVLLVIKSSDIGAYFTGRLIGRHKLIPWLSPGKTWEGLVGGVCFAALVGVGTGFGLRAAGFTSTPSPLMWGMAGAVFAFVGQAGDLMASFLKRDAGVKDSGSLLPGFGGLLDVLDSPILVAPVAFWWLRSAAAVSSGHPSPIL